ncbi:MAG: HAD-IA family hydrolase [Candidatus Omnitrophica bacterium]|nr:HAD-IA family hydrolase [Candidatus Omnitrophota bacterium]MDD5352404.1 HAD-IA family hydrolase [Candidatus Omnitrophota bacterium]MDD5550002.1 HAD-IA family hydrolase [Candidatus Omnitrophota bacterium]
MIKSIIFDFDGVIAESVEIKTGAFRTLFKDYPQCLKAIIEYHINNGGISRYDKFRFIYQNIIKEKLSEAQFNQLGKRFSELVVDKVVRSPLVEGAQELLDRCYGRYEMFVISGTPKKEIKEIIKRRKLEKYFTEIYGSPDKKTDLITNILRKNNYNTSEVVFIGDSVNDFNAAKEIGVKFIARIKDDNSNLPNIPKKSSFKNMRGVFEYIKNCI